MRDRIRPAAWTAGALTLAILIGSCGRAEGPELADPTTSSGPATTESAETTTQRSGAESLVATAAVEQVQVRAEPSEGAAVTTTLGSVTEFGSPTTFLVVGGDREWLEVLLPVRPNGSTGWVRSSEVSVQATSYRVAIDLERRWLTVFEGERAVLQSPVAVGAPDAPTPAGLHYVTDLLETPAPDGAYGPYAFGLSAHSDTYSEFAGGDGQIGIHGTNDPTSIGNAVSHGCIRLPNEVIAELAGMLPLGTPVHIA